MSTLLLTGFEPFLNNPINPTNDIVNALNGKKIGNYDVVGYILPVDYENTSKKLLDYYEKEQPDAVMMLGLAQGRVNLTPERIAINCNDGARDNTGFTPEDQPIDPDGADGYFSTLPIRQFVNVLQAEGLPAAISDTAGTYLCNNVMYTMLNHLAKADRKIPAGFVHVPASHELALHLNSRVPSWSTADLIRGIELLINTL